MVKVKFKENGFYDRHEKTSGKFYAPPLLPACYTIDLREVMACLARFWKPMCY